MKTGAGFALALALGVAVLARPATAQSTVFTYQGRLERSGGPASGLHDLRFRLFDAASGGTPLGAAVCLDNVAVQDGAFTVHLDFGQQFATPRARFLAIEVRADTGRTCADGTDFVTLSPRQLITAAPLANHAKAAFALNAADGSPTGAVMVDTEGRVGIATAAPASALHVESAANGDGVRLAGDGINSPAFQLYHAADWRGSLGLALTTGAWSTSAQPGDIVLRTNTGKLLLQNGFLNAAVAIVGNLVGVGTSTPRTRLEVHGDIRMGPGGERYAASGEENLRIVRGVVDGDGVILAGRGFRASKTSAGDYTITFDVPFSGPPALTATADQGPISSKTVTTIGVTAHWANIHIEDDFNRTFHFIAIGPR